MTGLPTHCWDGEYLGWPCTSCLAQTHRVSANPGLFLHARLVLEITGESLTEKGKQRRQRPGKAFAFNVRWCVFPACAEHPQFPV